MIKKELNYENEVKNSKALNKKRIYEIVEKDKKTNSYGHYEEYKEKNFDNAICGIGQIALNNGCDLFIFDNKLFLAESHDGDDFKSKNYFEECDYCYSVKLLSV
jgi:hypothetical protein